MNKIEKKNKLLQRRRWPIRKAVIGSPDRPRLVVTFTPLHIHAPILDDPAGSPLLVASTTHTAHREKKLLPNVAGATEFGKLFGEAAKNAGFSAVVFDRAGRRYHGTVKAFADAAREAGLQF